MSATYNKRTNGKWTIGYPMDVLWIMCASRGIPDVIITACCLHNLCIEFGDVDEAEFDDEDLDGVANEDGVEDNDEIGTAAGKRKRNAISYLLM
jgi:hypothetical protein